MNKSKVIIVILLLCVNALTSAQNKIEQRQIKLEFEYLKDGNIIKSTGYFIGFYMNKLNAPYPYTAVVVEKSAIKDAKKVLFHFPTTKGTYDFEIEDISQYLFTTPENSLVIIRLSPLYEKLKLAEVSEDTVFLTDGYLDEFSVPLNKKMLKQLEQSWQKALFVE